MEPEQRKQIIILAVLVVAAVGVIAYQFSGGSTPATTGAVSTGDEGEAGSEPKSVIADASKVDLNSLMQNIKEVDFDYGEEHVSRNPMRPLVGITSMSMELAAATPGGEAVNEQTDDARKIFMASRMRVSGIVYSELSPMAVVDGEVVPEGYRFPTGIVVQTIEPNRVVLRAGDTLVPRELREQ